MDSERDIDDIEWSIILYDIFIVNEERLIGFMKKMKEYLRSSFSLWIAHLWFIKDMKSSCHIIYNR